MMAEASLGGRSVPAWAVIVIMAVTVATPVAVAMVMAVVMAASRAVHVNGGGPRWRQTVVVRVPVRVMLMPVVMAVAMSMVMPVIMIVVVPMIVAVVVAVRMPMIMAMVMSTRLAGCMMMPTVMGSPRPGLLFDKGMRARGEILNRLRREEIDIRQRPQSCRLQRLGRSIALGSRTRKFHKGVSGLPGKTVGGQKLRHAEQ